MSSTIKLKCCCGKVSGVATNISPETGNHIVCMCDDCQAFARFLENSEGVLDENGGTHLFQLTPNKIAIHSGREYLKCLQMGPKGLKRWYADCCKTPIANTVSLKISLVGLFTNFIDFGNTKISKNEVIGPIRYRVMGKYGQGELPKNTHHKFPLLLILKMAKTILIGRLQKKYVPNTFFDNKTGKSFSQEMILSKDEREKLKYS